ncbi:FxLYD domain-containing protein [Methanobacterium oryzae]|uniref:FxLYD domain-containing protein n=1 Tax=Methanobacterium oryzae TaxID=69540 RepID=UPI003D1E3617
MRSIEFLCLSVVALFALITIYGFTNLNDESNLVIDQNNLRSMISNDNSSDENLKILNDQLTKTILNNWVVKGQAKNIGSNKVLYSTITVYFFDKNENLLYSTSASLKDISPGQIRDFEIPYQGSMTPHSYKLEYYFK